MSRGRSSWWRPSLSNAVWLAFFLSLTLSDWRLVFISADGDPSLHWRIGNWMIEHRSVLRADVFSHTQQGAPLISKEWLSEIAFAAAGNALGWNGIVLLAAVLVATTLWLLHRLLLREGSGPLLAAGLVLLAGLAGAQHWLARPHLVTHLLTVAFLWQLRSFEQGRIAASRLFAWLVPLMILWANLHGAFFTGFVLIGSYLAGSAWEARHDVAARRRTVTLVGLLLACIAGSLINPNSWRLHTQVLTFLRSSLLSGYVDEFRSPDFHAAGMRGFSLLLLVLAGLLIVRRPKLRTTDIVVIPVWGYFALHSVRNVPVFAVCVVPILAEHLSAILRQGTGDFAQVYQRLENRQPRTGGGALTVITVVATILLMARTPWIATDLVADRFPIAAVRFLKENPEAVQGEMFNDYGWGGYLMLALPKQKVFVDSRNDFYGESFLREFDTADEVRPGWEAIFEKRSVGWTILPRHHALNIVLALHPQWHLVYEDAVTQIFARQTTGAHRGLSGAS